MKRKGLVCASVCVVLLAASAAAPSLAGASEKAQNGQAAELVRALAALEQGNARQAIAIYDRLINTRKLPPELLARALLNRGLAHQRLKQYAAAITDYDAALRVDALSQRARVTALYNRALAFRAQGDAGRATEDLTAALYLDPAFAPAYFARGNILHERGLYYLALADYDQALANNHPQKYRVHYARALLFSALNSLSRTKEALYAALKEKPDFEPARRRLAAILRGRLPANRLFADLVKKQRAQKRITARIIPAGASGAAETNVRTASVMIVGAPVLNVRKAPQRMAAVPPGTMPPARQQHRQQEQGALLAGKPPAQKAWRVASVKALPPAPHSAEASPRATAERTQAATVAAARAPQPHQARPGGAGRLHTASVSPAPQPAHSGWAIQLASQRSEEGARAHWKKLERRVRRVVRAGKPDVMRAEIPGRGVFYRLRLVGFDDRASARRLCRGLKRRGISCLVVRAGG